MRYASLLKFVAVEILKIFVNLLTLLAAKFVWRVVFNHSSFSPLFLNFKIWTRGKVKHSVIDADEFLKNFIRTIVSRKSEVKIEFSPTNILIFPTHPILLSSVQSFCTNASFVIDMRVNIFKFRCRFPSLRFFYYRIERFEIQFYPIDRYIKIFLKNRRRNILWNQSIIRASTGA